MNSFANVSEKKIHDLDEKLDTLETSIAIFEEKMKSLPPEAFEHPPVEEPQVENLGQAQNLAMTDGIAKPVYIAPTENALMAAGANPK